MICFWLQEHAEVKSITVGISKTGTVWPHGPYFQLCLDGVVIIVIKQVITSLHVQFQSHLQPLLPTAGRDSLSEGTLRSSQVVQTLVIMHLTTKTRCMSKNCASHDIA